MNALSITKYLGRQSKPFLIILGFISVSLFGVIRYITGPDYAFSAFFLLPICMVTWFVGRGAGIIISIISAGTLIFADLVGQSYSRQLIPYLNGILGMSLFLIITHILSSLRGALEREKTLAMTDFLTKISNRRAFFELAQMEINRARRYKHPFTVILTDIDKFKVVNDYFGHQTGDMLLCLVANSLKRNLRKTDIVARVGGDEFGILLPETGANSVRLILTRLHNDLMNIMKEKGWPVAFSIGVVTFKSAPNTVDEIMKKADNLMYSAKQNAENKIKQEVVEETSEEEFKI
jgi:diguanylate cyclase (GGDEF)-like protein